MAKAQTPSRRGGRVLGGREFLAGLTTVAVGLALAVGIRWDAAAEEVEIDNPLASAPTLDPDEQPIPGVDISEIGSPEAHRGLIDTLNGQRSSPGAGERGSLYTVTSGEERRALVVIPEDYDPATPAPVVFGFHGYQGGPQDMADVGLDGLGAITVLPAGQDKAWQGAPYAATNDKDGDVAYVRDLIEQLDRVYSIDHDRIYAVGMSNGGGFAALLGCRMPEQFRAIASVAGAYYPGTYEGCAEGPVAFLEIHGGKDGVISIDGGPRKGSTLLAARAMVERFRERDGCAAEPEADRIGKQIVSFTWHGCAAGTGVQHVAVGEMEHEWPTGDDRGPKLADGTPYSATSAVADFFREHGLGDEAE